MNVINQHQRAYKEEFEGHNVPLSKKPAWLKVKLPSGDNYNEVKTLMRKQQLHTVCEEAKCPNMGECWESKSATYIILGDTCTRSCGFCNIKTGLPNKLDLDEPRRLAETVVDLGLRHVVITSVNRDELEDGGASIFSECVRLINEMMPETTVEILIPDFRGIEKAFDIIMKNPPDILNHNVETVPRLYHIVRPQAKYNRSLNVIRWFKDKYLRTKSGIMVGIGENPDEVLSTMKDLHEHGCDILTIGQYLQPTKNHLPVHRYVTLDEFRMYKEAGMKMGFKIVESSPLVRSSYHADKHARAIF